MARVSYVSKRPVQHFMNWADKEQKQFNKRVKEQLQQEGTYLGPNAVFKDGARQGRGDSVRDLAIISQRGLAKRPILVADLVPSEDC